MCPQTPKSGIQHKKEGKRQSTYGAELIYGSKNVLKQNSLQAHIHLKYDIPDPLTKKLFLPSFLQGSFQNQTVS